MIAVDTNVVAYLFLRGEFAARAEAWLMRDRDWVAPKLWRSEFTCSRAICDESNSRSRRRAIFSERRRLC